MRSGLGGIVLRTRRGYNYCLKLKTAARPKLALERAPETIKLNLKTEPAQSGIFVANLGVR